MKYHKFFYPTEPEAQEFVASIQGDFQSVILPRYSTPKSEDDEPQLLEGFLAHKYWGAGSLNPLPSNHPYKNIAP